MAKANFSLFNKSNGTIIDVYDYNGGFYTRYSKIKIINNKVWIDGACCSYLEVIK